jgi:undecaprenyl pyrophosphate phosphatase UppP
VGSALLALTAPAAIVGALAYRVIKSYLFTCVVCISLVIGGLVCFGSIA